MPAISRAGALRNRVVALARSPVDNRFSSFRGQVWCPGRQIWRAALDEVQSRLQEALRRRLYPNAPLHLKQIASALGRSENTVTRWWRGETNISGQDLYELSLFFSRRGDSGFFREMFIDLIPAAAAVQQQETDSLILARAILERAGQGIPMGDDSSHSWFTADGTLTPADEGLRNLVREALDIPERTADLTAYAARVLGWIAVTRRPDNVLAIRHDGRRVAPLAAERLCEWLDDRADRISRVRRLVLVSGEWIEAQHDDARSAAHAIARVAFLTSVPRGEWTVRRLSLDSLADPMLAQLLRVHTQAPHDVVNTAARMGAFTTSTLFGVKGDDVVCHHLATGFGFDPAVEGLNVLARADTEYALMIQARMLKTAREGPTYYELVGTIDDRHARYFNLALPEPGTGRVLSSSAVMQLERITEASTSVN